MSTRRLTDVQFSQNHAIDGTRVQAAIDDVFERFNKIPLEDQAKRHTLQTVVLKCTGYRRQDQATFSKTAATTLVGTDRPEAPFLDHAMITGSASPVYRAKGVPEASVGHSFAWTASTFFLKPVTLESVSVHIDGTTNTPFAADAYDLTFTGAHGLNVGEKFYTSSNNAWIMSGASPAGLIDQIFRVVDVSGTHSLRAVWWAARGANHTPAPGLALDPANPLTVTDGAATLTASAVAHCETQALNVLIDCPYLQYSTERRLNSKVFSRRNFTEESYGHFRLSEDTAATADMYPLNIPFGGYVNDMRGIYYDAHDLNIALPSAQAVNFRLAVGTELYPFFFPSNIPRVTYTITYREQILD